MAKYSKDNKDFKSQPAKEVAGTSRLDDDAAPAGIENGQQDSKQAQRRQYFRLVYPANAAPKITNLPLRVIDISMKAVRFTLCGEITDGASFEEGQEIQMVFKFHDEQLVEIGGVIFRHSTDQVGRKIYVCKFNRELPAELVNKEQAFLLKNYPEFCRHTTKIFKPLN